MPKFGMVIDLQRCVGCGCCTIACKAENNTRNRADGQSHNWADLLIKTEGSFPNVAHVVRPKAMFKTREGVTMHDPALCIGCQTCQRSCPYSNIELDARSLNGETYSV